MEYEIVHSGIKGMKWGIRRYQNRDGTLTDAGKKRYAKQLAKVREEEQALKNRQAVKAKLDRLEARQKAVEEGKKALAGTNKTAKPKPESEPKADKPKKKTIHDLSDDELSALIKRTDMERQYRELQYKHAKLDKDFRELNPKQVSAGKKFMKEYVTPMLGETLKSLGKDFVVQKGKEWLGLTTEGTSKSEKLKKGAEDAKNKYLIENYNVKFKNLKNGKVDEKKEKDDD